jgi:hypothetical protein
LYGSLDYVAFSENLNEGCFVDLSIIIVNYNVKEFLQNLIRSIQKASKNCQTEIIVVDNASDDGSVDLLKEKFPNVIKIFNSSNLGFSKANNLALKIAKGKYFLLVNPDSIVQEDTFDTMINFFETHPEVGLAGCKILNPDGKLQLACRRSFPGPWTSFCKVTGLSTFFPKSKIFARYNLTYLDENSSYEVDAVSGSFMMIRNEVYKKIGGLDESFFMYGEDIDWCYRVQKAGFKVYYMHSTQIIHYKGESTKRSNLDETKLFYNAMHLFVKKHLSSSIIVEIILRSAIMLRSLLAFLGKKKLILISILLDFIFFNCALYLSEKLYGTFNGGYKFPRETLLIVFSIPAIIQILVSSVLGVYRKDNTPVLKSLTAVFFGFFVISSLTFFFKEYAYSRVILLLTYILLVFMFSGWRIFLKLFFKIGLMASESSRVKTLVVGVSDTAVEIANKLKSKHTDLHSVEGLIGLSRKEIGEYKGGFNIIGSLDTIFKTIQERKIREVIFSSNDITYNQMMKIVSECQKENIEFKLAGSELDFLVGKTAVNIMDNIPIIEITYNISQPLNKFLKRIFDIVLSIFILFIIYPFIFVVTKIGKIKTSLSDFILNVPSVLSGEMSFVGPEESSKDQNFFLGKKGLTGFWFVEEENSDKLNIFYAKNQNIWLDLEILGRTISKLFFR